MSSEAIEMEFQKLPRRARVRGSRPVLGDHTPQNFLLRSRARLASWCCQGISTVLCVALLLAYAHSQEGGWILAIAAVIGLNFIVTLVMALALVPDSAPRAGKGFYDVGNPKK